MRRYNLIQARGAEFTCGTEGIASEGEGSDVIELQVRRGTVSIIVPADTPDGQVCEECWFDHHTCLDIELEDGTHITGWVRGGEAYLEASLASRKSVGPAATDGPQRVKTLVPHPAGPR
jgi:hypothetical protein